MEGRVLTGVGELDRITGGLPAGRIYVVTGDLGSGKSELSILYLLEGLRRGERCLWISSGRPQDLFLTCEAMGIDLDPYFEDEQLVVIHPASDFPDLIVSNSDAKMIADEIGRWADSRDRVVVESFSSLLESRYPITGNPGFFSTLLNGFDDNQATFWIAEGARDVPDGPAWRVLERFAFGLFHIEEGTGEKRSLRVRKLRGSTTARQSISFRFAPNGRIVFPGDTPAAETAEGGRVFLLRSDDGMPEIEGAFMDRYDVTVSKSPMDATARIAKETYELAVIELRDRSSSPFEVCARLRESGVRTPVLFVGGRRMRALDRIRCFRSGGDDIVVQPINRDELRHRAENLIRQGRSVNMKVQMSLAQQSFAERFAAAGDVDRTGALFRRTPDDDTWRFAPRIEERFRELIGLVAETRIGSVGYVARFESTEADDKIGDPAPGEAAEVAIQCCRSDDLVVGASGGEVAIILVGADENGFSAYLSRLEAKLTEYFGGEVPVMHRYGTVLWPAEGKDENVPQFLVSLVGALQAAQPKGRGAAVRQQIVTTGR